MKTTVSEKGQITIPKRLRDRLGLQPGSVLDFEEAGGRLVGRKMVPADHLDELVGILPRPQGGSDELIRELRGPRAGRRLSVITAVDTSVLLDIFFDEPTFRPLSIEALRACLAAGLVVACDVVWAEVRAVFGDDDAATRALAGFPVSYSAIDPRAATRAGAAWGDYRRGGGPRDRVIADFLVGAHALEQADRLLSRDRGFHRRAFAGLVIVDPAATGG